MLRGLQDFAWGQLLLWAAPYPRLARLLLRGMRAQTYECFRASRCVVVKGGGFLHAFGGVSAAYYIWYQLFYLRLAQRLQKPVIVLPNSFGPFVGLTVRRQIRAVLARCAFVAARESISARALEHVIGKPASVYPDMAYYLAPAAHEVGETICRRYGVPISQRRCVGITVRPWRFPGTQDPTGVFDRYIASVVDLIQHLTARGFHAVLVTHVAGPSAHEDDRIAIREVCSRLAGTEYSWVDFDADCRTLKAVYGCMDFVVGTRFHSVIFAQGMGVPCLAIAYGGNKAMGIMHDMGLGDYVIPAERVDGPALCARFDQLVKHADEVRLCMQRYSSRARELREEMLQQISSALGLQADSPHDHTQEIQEGSAWTA